MKAVNGGRLARSTWHVDVEFKTFHDNFVSVRQVSYLVYLVVNLLLLNQPLNLCD